MKPKSILASLAALAILTTGIVLFIRKSNDHRECETVTYKTTDANGETTTTTKHVCRERFNF